MALAEREREESRMNADDADRQAVFSSALCYWVPRPRKRGCGTAKSKCFARLGSAQLGELWRVKTAEQSIGIWAFLLSCPLLRSQDSRLKPVLCDASKRQSCQLVFARFCATDERRVVSKRQSC